jgi:hypothetical protein
LADPFWIGRNKLGIPLACPQICDRTESVVAEAEVRLMFDGPAVAGQAQENAEVGAGPDIDLAAAAALRERMKGKQ